MVQFLLKFEPAGIMTLRFLDLERKKLREDLFYLYV